MSCSSNNMNRRTVATGFVSLATIALADSLLAGCMPRKFNDSKTQDAASDAGAQAALIQKMATEEFFPLYDAFQKEPDTAKRDSLIKTLILVKVKTNPMGFMDYLRKEKVDILAPGGSAPTLILSHAGVVDEVLNPARVHDYTTPSGTPSKRTNFLQLPYIKEMSALTGHYLLCDDDVPRHDAEKAWTHKAVLASDEQTLRDSIFTHAEALVKAARKKAGAGAKEFEIDVVQDVARWLPIHVVESYFGVPSSAKAPKITLNANDCKLFADKKAGDKVQVTQAMMYEWIADSFRNLFLNLGGDKDIQDRGRKHGAMLIWYFVKLIDLKFDTVKTKATLADNATVLERMIWLYQQNVHSSDPNNHIFDNEEPSSLAGTYLSGMDSMTGKDNWKYRLASQMAGSVAGAGVTVEESIARVFSVLLRFPERMKECIEFSQDAKNSEAYVHLRPYYREALRIAPQAEMLPRIAAVETKLKGNSRGGVPTDFTIAPGSLVFACIYAAAHDERVAANPADFIPKRDPRLYLEFGGPDLGLVSSTATRHSCVGRYIAPVEIVGALRAILKGATAVKGDPQIKFSDDKAGSGDGRGPFANSLKIMVSV